MNTETLIIPAEKVAEILGSSKRTLWRLLSTAKLPVRAEQRFWLQNNDRHQPALDVPIIDRREQTNQDD